MTILWTTIFTIMGIIGGVECGEPLTNLFYIPAIVVVAFILYVIREKIKWERGRTK